MAPAGIGDRVEGLHAVRAAVAAGRVTHLFVLEAVAKKETELLQAVQAREGVVDVLDDLAGIAETSAPQGVVARARPIPTVELRALVKDRPALVVLDHLEDVGNVGAIARTATAAGMTGMVVASRRAAPLGPGVFKASAGALESLPVATLSSVADAVVELRDVGIWTVGLEARAEASIFGLELLAEPVALIIGAEGSGLARLVRERVDVLARVPMATETESLNASVAAAIAMYEVLRVRSELD
ncbi:MAG: 23S rRNA (guanosine(2251)-2'-O)-methyltransferase RlmB [Acidimicrobiia bacterium]